jgi:hypothetical protein
VAALLALGADRAAVNLNGEAPFDVAHRPPRHDPGHDPVANVNPHDEQAVEAARQVATARVERERSAYDVVLLLVPPGQSQLIDGCVTPRNLTLLRRVARNADDRNRDIMRSLQNKPVHVSKLQTLRWFGDLPVEIFQQNSGKVMKSFVLGFGACVESIMRMLNPEWFQRQMDAMYPGLEVGGPRRAAKLPTVQRVMEDIIRLEKRTKSQVNFFLDRGGKVGPPTASGNQSP